MKTAVFRLEMVPFVKVAREPDVNEAAWRQNDTRQEFYAFGEYCIDARRRMVGNVGMRIARIAKV